MGEIRFFEVTGERFELTAGNPYAASLIQNFAQFNADGNDTLGQSEILSAAAKSGQQSEAAYKLMYYKTVFRSLAKVPTTRIPYERFKDRMTEAVEERLKKAPKVNIKATSVAEKDPRGQTTFNGKDSQLSQEMAARYYMAYSGKQKLPPNVLDVLSKDVIKRAATFTAFDYGPVFDHVLDFGDGHELPAKAVYFVDEKDRILRETYYYPGKDEPYLLSTYFPYPSLLMGLVFVKENEKEIKTAGEIIEHHHRDITKGNLTSLLAFSFINEMISFQEEDRVQDVGACRACGCSMQSSFSRVFSECLDFTGLDDDCKLMNALDTPILDLIAGLTSRAIWEVGSLKYDKENQGYGIGQIIPDLAMEAARDKTLLKDYAPYISEADFQDTNSTICAILDRKKAIYIKALTLDHVVKRLEGSIFSSAVDFKIPMDWICPVSDDKAAREVGLMTYARWWLGFPELARKSVRNEFRYPIFFQIFGEMIWIGSLTGFPVTFEGVRLKETPGKVMANKEVLEKFGIHDKDRATLDGVRLDLVCE